MSRTTVLLIALAALLLNSDTAQARYRGGMNLYAYVGGMPTKYVDPSGLVVNRGPTGPDPRLKKGTCKIKKGPYTTPNSGCKICDWECECPSGYNAAWIPMTYKGWPCDQAPEIYCRQNRNMLREIIEVLVGTAIISGTIAEDVVTAGAGIIDDPPCIAAGIFLICPSPRPKPIGPGPQPIVEVVEVDGVTGPARIWPNATDEGIRIRVIKQ